MEHLLFYFFYVRHKFSELFKASSERFNETHRRQSPKVKSNLNARFVGLFISNAVFWRKCKYGNRIINSRIVQETVSTELSVCPREFTARRLWKKVTKAITALSEEFYLIYSNKNRQKLYIYHCCMLCLTDPAAAGAFRTWRPPKSLISPSSGELSPLRDASPVIRCRRRSHKVIIAVYDCFR